MQTIRNSEPQFRPEVLSDVLSHLRAGLDPERAADERVLHNLLYFVDFNYYEKHEEQLTGSMYRKDAAGPTNVEFKKSAVTETAGNAALDTKAMAVIDEVLAKYATVPLEELAAQARHDVPWLTAKACQPIDYESVFYRTSDLSVRVYLAFVTVIDQLTAVASLDNWEVIYDQRLDSLYWKMPSLSKGRVLKVSRETHLYLSPSGKLQGVLVECFQNGFAKRHPEFVNLTEVIKSRSHATRKLFIHLAETLKADIYRDAAEDQLTTEDLNFMMADILKGWPSHLHLPTVSSE